MCKKIRRPAAKRATKKQPVPKPGYEMCVKVSMVAVFAAQL